MATIGEYTDRIPYVHWLREKLGLNNYKRRRNLLAMLFIVPPVLFMIVLGIFPALYTGYLSITDMTIFETSGNIVWFEKYNALYDESLFWDSIWTGIFFALGSTVFQMVVGLGLALVLNTNFRGGSIARTFAIFPYLVPTIAVALMWKWMLSPVYGIVNKRAVAWGLIGEPIAFFNDATFAMYSLIFANSWKFTSFAFIIFLARLQAIDDRLYEQARITGANVFQQFRDITLPNLKSAILLVLFIRSIWMFNKFDIVWLLTRGGPLDATTTVPVFIYRVTFNEFDLALGSAAAINLFLGLIVFAVIYFWVFKPSQEVETG